MRLPNYNPKLDYEPRTWVDISTLDTVARCPHKAFLRYGCGLEKPGVTIRLAMDYGSAIHKALPTLLANEDKGRPAALALAMTAFWSVWTNDHEAVGDDKRNATRALASLDQFWSTHTGRAGIYKLVEPPRSTTIQTKDHVSDYEIPFAIDIGIGIPLVGRVDALVEHRDTKELYVLEWKTTAQGGGWFLDCFDLNPQPIGYFTALSLMGMPVKGAFIEAIVSSKVKADTLTKVLYVNEGMQAKFLEWARFWGRFLLECERQGSFPQWFSGCTSYPMFGQPGFKCPYIPLCQQPGDPGPLYDMYAVSRWDPFKVEGAGE